MSNFVIADRSPKRFDGDFTIDPVSSYSEAPLEKDYRDTVERVTSSFANDETQDTTGTQASSARSLARQRLRASAAAKLRTDAEEFAAGRLAPDIAADNALVIKGQYVAETFRLSRSLFVVREKVENNLAIELVIAVNSYLPPPDDVPSPD